MSEPVLGLAVPVYDEAEIIEAVVEELRAALVGLRAVVVLVDNGSTDATPRLVDGLSVASATWPDLEIIAAHHRTNAGYGGGILSGLRTLRREVGPDVLGWMWGDGQVDPAVLPALAAAVRAGAPAAKVVRTERQDGLQRRVVTAGYHALTGALGLPGRDLNGCPKLFAAPVLADLDLKCTDWFLDAEAMIGLDARGLEPAEVPAVMRPRPGGRSKVRASTALEFAVNLARWKLS